MSKWLALSTPMTSNASTSSDCVRHLPGRHHSFGSDTPDLYGLFRLQFRLRILGTLQRHGIRRRDDATQAFSSDMGLCGRFSPEPVLCHLFLVFRTFGSKGENRKAKAQHDGIQTDKQSALNFGRIQAGTILRQFRRPHPPSVLLLQIGRLHDFHHQAGRQPAGPDP